jgi:type II restriction/modification system DNA methylase subunit YeeA
MNPAEFVRKWSDSELRERQGSQEHFIDLCRLLGEPTPAEADPKGERYCFERGAGKVGGGDGWADVWRRGCFGWEYKGHHKDLNAALRQLQAYALDLENPPYLVVSDMLRIVVHTNWTNTVSARHEFSLDDLRHGGRLEDLRAVFQGSERLKPGISPQEITAKVAAKFGELGRRLQERKHEPRAVAHFLNRIVFCMFAEDSRLLPAKLLSETIKATRNRPTEATAQLGELFAKMGTGGFFGRDAVRWFDGGLFEDASVLPLTEDDLKLIVETAEAHDWSEIDPAIFGTLFEQALKATRERPALGAHYTDREKILKIVEPVIIRPLTAEWESHLVEIQSALDEAAAAEKDRKLILAEGADALRRGDGKAGEAGRRKAINAALKRKNEANSKAKEIVELFRDRLAAFRVLDPACGSGNFLYVALHALKDLEVRAIVDAERLGIASEPLPRVGLECVKGIEIEPYAAELARVTLWIGDLQWMRKNAYTAFSEPILSTLDQIEERDALLNEDGTEAEWPEADVVIGNPPFLGGKRMRDNLGNEYVERLFETYAGRVPAEADFVCYWVEKAWRDISRAPSPPLRGRDGEGGNELPQPSSFPPPSPSPARGEGVANAGALRAGLVTTNSIRGGANRRVLAPIAASDAIHEAWDDEEWVLEGAAVRVSMIGFGAGFAERRLDGRPVAQINSDLTATAVDLTQAARLTENKGVAFMGDTKGGAFDIPGELAREWLQLPLNPNGRPNSDVLKPWRNAMDVTRRPADKWIIDFGWTMTEAEAALYEAPFQYTRTNVKPERLKNNREAYRLNWWRHVEPRQGMWRAMEGVRRYIATPRVAKHRSFVWLASPTVPDSRIFAFARSHDALFGFLSSRLHELWSLRTASWHGVGNDPTYNVESCFETFPFPEGLTPNISATDYAGDPYAVAIADAARELNRLRENWLNPATSSSSSRRSCRPPRPARRR